MAKYDVKNVQVVWRGITLTGFGDDYVYSTEQDGDSFEQRKGVQGDGLNIVNNQRKWKINSTFLVNSVSLPILEQDNLNYVEDTLIVRDLNTGNSDSYTDCVVLNITGKQDSNTRTVSFGAMKCNGK